MFFNKGADKHNLPHIHAEYQGEVAVYSIPDGNLLAGKIPSKKEKLVIALIKFIKRICLPIENLLLVVKFHLKSLLKMVSQVFLM
jgi:hypothetical protein